MRAVWFGKLKFGLEAFVTVILFRNCGDVHGSGLQVFSLFSPCFLLCRFFTLCTRFAVDEIGGYAFKLIIDVAGSFIFECRAKRFLFEDFYGFLY